MARKKITSDKEFTVSGNDVLSLVANIDEKQDELKLKSTQYREEHPEVKEPQYDNAKSLPVINNVISNVLGNKMNDEQIKQPEVSEKDIAEMLGMLASIVDNNKANKMIDDIKKEIEEPEEKIEEIVEEKPIIKQLNKLSEKLKEDNIVNNTVNKIISNQEKKLDPEYLQIKDRNIVPEASMNEPNQQMRLKKWQVEENMKCFDKVNGPLYFLGNYCWVNCGKIIPYELRPYSTEFIYCMHNFDRSIFLQSRQSGKTTSACLYILWLCMFNKDQQALLTSYNYDQTVMKNMATIKTAYEYTPSWLKPGIVKWNEQTIKFDNGSEIIAKTTTEDCVRGTSPNIIYSDELAFTFKGNTASQKQFYTSISPALSASKGKLCITSTPLSEFDVFFSIWDSANRFKDDDGNDFPKIYVLRNKNGVIVDLHKFDTFEEANMYNKEHPELEANVFERNGIGYNGFVSFKTTWKDLPGRTEEWARLERINMGDLMFEREYNCLSGDNYVSIQLPDGEIRNVPLNILYDFYGCNLD